MKTQYIIWVYRGKKIDKLVFNDKVTFNFYCILLELQKIKYTGLEVLCFDD